MKKIRGVVGHPIEHSLSPIMHNAGYKALGLSDEFLSFDVKPEDLENFVLRVRREKIDGLAITIPHKEKIMAFLDYVNPEARVIGAVNTLYWNKDELCGANTDYLGFFTPISDFKGSSLVLGAGGASRACIYALKLNNCGEIFVWARDFEKAKKLADEFDISVVKSPCFADLVINTTPVGMFPKTEASVLPSDYWQSGQIAYDLVMNPCKTKFILDAQKAGVRVIFGKEMLLHQGIEQFRIWTKKKAPENIMRQSITQN